MILILLFVWLTGIFENHKKEYRECTLKCAHEETNDMSSRVHHHRNTEKSTVHH